MQARIQQHEAQWTTIDALWGDGQQHHVLWITCDEFRGRQQLIDTFGGRYPAFHHVFSPGTGFEDYEGTSAFQFLKDTVASLIDPVGDQPAVLHLTHLEAYLPVFNKFGSRFWDELAREKDSLLHALGSHVVLWTHSHCLGYVRTRHPLLFRSGMRAIHFLPLQRLPYPHSPKSRYLRGHSERTDLINAAHDFLRSSKFAEALDAFTTCIELCLEDFQLGDAIEAACLATQLLMDLQRYEEAAKAWVLLYNMYFYSGGKPGKIILEKLQSVLETLGTTRRWELLHDLFDFGEALVEVYPESGTAIPLHRNWKHQVRRLDDRF